MDAVNYSQRTPSQHQVVFHNDARKLLAQLQNADEVTRPALRVFLYVHHSQRYFQDRSFACASEGVIGELVRAIRDTELEQTRTDACHALGAMCFFNEPVSTLVAQEDGFLDLTRSVISIPEICYVINNVAAYSPASHQELILLVPQVMEIVRDGQYSTKHRAWCVRFCGQLAYNLANREQLLGLKMENVLVEVMLTGDVDMGCCTAAVAMGCLVGPQSDSEALDAANSGVVLDLVTQAFDAAVHNSDFPTNSNVYYSARKLAMGISNLAANQTNREQFRQYGLGEALGVALTHTAHQNDPALTKHALITVWRLGQDDQKTC